MTVHSTEISSRHGWHATDQTVVGHYQSPLGGITLMSDEIGLTDLKFDGSSSSSVSLDDETPADRDAVIAAARHWLDIYFAGQVPDIDVPLHLVGTAFQLEIWRILLTIPYGTVRTYGDIAHELAEDRGISRMSAQAVGGAVGRNPVALIVPCHRVIGAHGLLGGYADGAERKLALLQIEGIDIGGLDIGRRC